MHDQINAYNVETDKHVRTIPEQMSSIIFQFNSKTFMRKHLQRTKSLIRIKIHPIYSQNLTGNSRNSYIQKILFKSHLAHLFHHSPSLNRLFFAQKPLKYSQELKKILHK